MGVKPIWTCPICREALLLNESASSWRCENNHLFDCAREGYVNLLPSNKKRSSEPGDSAEMIAARRRILGAEIYRPLADSIQAQLAGMGSITRILDLGCGEGYYSNAMRRVIPDAIVCGVDISKPAVRLAAKQYSSVNFAVASSFTLPLAAASQDLVVRIFAPSDEAEVSRVLKAEGAYLEVTPAPRHLWALREALYDTPRAHSAAREEVGGLSLCQSSTVEFKVELDQALLHDLVAMTPFAHRGHREKREQLLALDSLTVQMAFSLKLFQKLGG